MGDWPRITENLIIQNSHTMNRERGGAIGPCQWFYVNDIAGVRTIDPVAEFYLYPPPNAICAWSTEGGRIPPRHIFLGDGSTMPHRDFVHWNDETLLRRFDEYRRLYVHELTNLTRPNTFEDLYLLFDSSTLYFSGAYNMWTLVNMLVTHAHNEYPRVLQSWKTYIEQVIYDYFSAVPGPQSDPDSPGNIQLLRNQAVLRNWDQNTDPLLLLYHTNFPVGELHQMNIQQHGLFRDCLVMEHARLTGTMPTFPISFNYARASVSATPSIVNNQTQGAPVNNATQAGASTTAIEESKPRLPIIAVGRNEPYRQLNAEPQDAKVPATSATGNQPPTHTSPPSALLASIPEESAIAKTDDLPNIAETETSGPPSNVTGSPLRAKPFVPGQVVMELAPLAEKHIEAEVAVPTIDTEDAVPTLDTKTAQFEAPVPDIITREATPTHDDPVRDRKDSNGSTDKLFFPDAPSNKLHVARQLSITSAPDLESAPMLTVDEKNARSISETPPMMQVNHSHPQLPSRPDSTASDPTAVAGESPHRYSMPGRSQGCQYAGHIGASMPHIPQQGPQMGPPCRHTSLMVPPNGPPDGMAQAPNAFNSAPAHMQFVPDGFGPYCGPPAPPGINVGPHAGPLAGLHIRPHIRPHLNPPMGPPFQEQMPPHMNQHQYGPHGPPMSVSPAFMGPKNHCAPSGYQQNGYVQQRPSYGNRGGHNGYSNNGYRSMHNSNNIGGPNRQWNGKRRDCNQSNGPRRNRGNSTSSAVSLQQRQTGSGFPTRNNGRSGPPERQFHNQMGPLVDADSRRGSDPFRGQRPMDVLSGLTNSYGIGPGSLLVQHDYSNPAYTEQMPAPDFTQAQGIVYQKVPPQMASRELYDPKAPRRRDSKFENRAPPAVKATQQPGPKPGFSKDSDARIQQIMEHDTWRPLQTKPASDEAIANEDNDAADPLKDTASTLSVKSVKILLPSEEGSTHEAVSSASRSISPEVDDETQGMIEEKQPQTHGPNLQNPQIQRNSKQQPEKYQPQQEHSKVKSHKKSQKDKSQKEHATAVGLKLSDQGCEKGALKSETKSTTQTAESVQQSHASNGDTKATNPSSRTITPGPTKHVQPDTTTEFEPMATDKNAEEKAASSRAATPDVTKPGQDEIMTHHKKSTARNNHDAGTKKNPGKSQPKAIFKKDQQRKVSEAKQTSYRKTTAELPAPVECLREQTTKSETVMGPYRKTTGQLSSAIEELGYATETVIRRKTARPSVLTSWASDVDSEDFCTKTPSPTEGTLPPSAIAINRFSSICAELGGVAALQDTLGGLSASAEETFGSTEAATANDDAVNHEASKPVAPESTAQTQEKPKNGRHKKSKGKGQGSASHLTSRSNTSTPTDTQSRGPSPAFTDASSRGPSPAMQNPNDPRSVSAEQSKKQVHDNKRKQLLLKAEASDGLAKSGGSPDNKEQRTRPGSSLHKVDAMQATSMEKLAERPTTAKAPNESHASPLNQSEKSRNTNFSLKHGGGSLRMAKNRSPKKYSQKNGPQGNKEIQGSTRGGAASLATSFQPPLKRDKAVAPKAVPIAQQKSLIDVAEDSALLTEASQDKPNSQAITSDPTKDEHKFAFPKAGLTFSQVTPATKPSSNWASVAKSGASQATRADKKKIDELFAPGKDSAPLGDYIQTKNAQSPQKPQVNEEENTSNNQTSPTPSPEKKSRRGIHGKSQLNASVQSFNPSTAVASAFEPPKLKLNPTAPAFSSSSPAERGGSVAASTCGLTGRILNVVHKKDNDQPLPTIERSPAKSAHSKKPSLPGHRTSMDKRFVTPAEQVLDSSKVTQPPPPSKDSRRVGPIPDRSNGDAIPTQAARNVSASGVAGETANGAQNIDITKISTAPLQMASPKTVGEVHPDVGMQTLNNDGFPTLDEAAAAGPTKKRRTASIVKAGQTSVVITASVHGTVVGSDINNTATQKGGAKSQQTPAQRSFTAPTLAAAKIEQPKVEQVDVQKTDPKQPGERADWKTVSTRKQKNNAGGSDRGGGGTSRNGGRSGRWAKSRDQHGERSAQGAATDERKGG